MSEIRNPSVETASELLYGCFFCRSGKEEAVISNLALRLPQAECLTPTKLRYRRVGGRAYEEKCPLFPGYVFFRTTDERIAGKLPAMAEGCRLLTYGDQDWPLTASDRAIAKSFFDANGVIGFSKAWYEGDRIHIQDGFLKNYEGCISRVNRRAKTAEITVNFQGKTIKLWLGFELLNESETHSRKEP